MHNTLKATYLCLQIVERSYMILQINIMKKNFPMFSLTKYIDIGSVKYDNGVMNVIQNSQYGFITIGVIPYAELYNEINALNNKIYIISFISLISILLLTYLSTKVFSKRIKTVIKAIHKIQKGNLFTRIQEEKSDEIGEIAKNLDDMCDKLSQYIEREYISNLKAKDAEIKQNESLLRQKAAEMYALQSQIDPHFLYNTLEAIRMKSLINKESDAAKMIRLLSSMFRNSTKKDMIVSVSDELEFCNSYLNLYKIRFGGNLKVNFKIDPLIIEYGIIKHLLQPIIENCVIHGIDLGQEGNLIEIEGYLSDGNMFIAISDNGIGLKAEELQSLRQKLQSTNIDSDENIGVSNVNYRIKLIYGEAYGLAIDSIKDIGTKVTLKLSIKTKEELTHYVQCINS